MVSEEFGGEIATDSVEWNLARAGVEMAGEEGEVFRESFVAENVGEEGGELVGEGVSGLAELRERGLGLAEREKIGGREYRSIIWKLIATEGEADEVAKERFGELLRGINLEAEEVVRDVGGEFGAQAVEIDEDLIEALFVLAELVATSGLLIGVFREKSVEGDRNAADKGELDDGVAGEIPTELRGIPILTGESEVLFDELFDFGFETGGFVGGFARVQHNDGKFGEVADVEV